MPYIEVDLEDIRLANDLAAHIMGHSLDELSRPAHDLLLQLEAMTNEAARENGQPDFFTRRQIREYSGWNHSRVHRYLKELVTLEYGLVSSGRGAFRQTYRLCYNGEGKQGQRFLLGLRPVEELKEPEPVSTVSPPFHSSESPQASTACRVRSKPVHSSKKGKAQ